MGGVGMALSAARKPEGGFQFIAVRQLCAVWCAYEVARIRLFDVRVWFAAQELVARRCQLRAERRPIYACDELARVVGGVGDVLASIHRLQASGLLTWTPHRITFNLSLPEPVSSAFESIL